MGLPLLRGTIEGAKCTECPFSTDGKPTRPIVSEYPEEPKWALIADGPTRTEVQVGRPLIGQGGQLVNKALGKIGCDRNTMFVGYATLCQPPFGFPEDDRDRAADACRPRLQAELAQFPGIPVLTLGTVAARAVIPKAALEAVDPPDVPRSVKRSQKDKQKAEAKLIAKALTRSARGTLALANKRLKVMMKYRVDQIVDEGRQQRRKIKRADAERLITDREYAAMKEKSRKDAAIEWKSLEHERELAKLHELANPKPKKVKPKKIKITDIMGTCFRVDVDGSGIRPVIPSIHPAALLRGGGATIGGTHTPDLAFVNLIWDAVKVQNLAQGKNIYLDLNVETEITSSERTVALLLEVVHEAIAEGKVAIDLETYVDDIDRHHALMAYMAQVRAIGFATSKRAVSILWDLIPPWAFSYLQLLLAHGSVKKIFHNGLYDRTVLAARGFVLAGPWGDTLLLHHAAFPGNSHKLQVVTSQFRAIEPWKSEFRNAEETPESLTKYNAKDTGATLAIEAPLAVWVKKTNTEKVYNLDIKMSEIASRMHLDGMPVSREVNSELLASFTKVVKSSRAAVEAIATDTKLHDQIQHFLAVQQAGTRRKKDPESYEDRYYLRKQVLANDTDWKWKINSGKHVAALLQAMGVSLTQTTTSGQLSTKKDILESLVDVPVIRDLLGFREADKLNSTFLWQIFDRFDKNGDCIQHGFADDNDRIHPIWSIHKISGRWGSAEPVVSNVPKDKWKGVLLAAVPELAWLLDKSEKFWAATDDDGYLWRKDTENRVSKRTRPNLRSQIVAPPGRIFVGFDFAQLEARIIALVSGDPFLCQVFADGKDIHRECARVIFSNFDELPEKEQKKAREETKPLEYGAFYGGAPETLWKQLLKEGRNVKLADVAKSIQTLMNQMRGVVKWQREVVARALDPRSGHEIRDIILGRRRTFPMGQVEATEAMNAEIQFTAAAIMNLGMDRMCNDRLPRYKQAFPIAQIHDASVFECWIDDAPLIAADCKTAFFQEHEYQGRKVPFPVDIKINKTWAGV